MAQVPVATPVARAPLCPPMSTFTNRTHEDKAVVPVPTTVRASQPRRIIRQAIPDSILKNEELNRAIAESLPPNYSFEVPKTVWRIQQLKATTVALQFPEGLLMYSTTLSDLLERFAGVKHCIILGDVAYGACCIDDITASMLGAELLVHYGHSCLVPVSSTRVPSLYVFVGIAVDTPHLIATIEHNFCKDSTHVVIAGTIQFSAAVQQASAALRALQFSVAVPQAKPLSSGEVLGCTAPRLADKGLGLTSSSRPLSHQTSSQIEATQLTQIETDGGRKKPVLVFVADGRFHLEAMMIANPDIPAYRYDPFTRHLLREHYDHRGMRTVRRSAVETARGATEWGVVLGTLGRQGNLRTLDYVQGLLRDAGKRCTVFLVSELSPAKVAKFAGIIEAWVQIACPRLSIDWGEAFSVPLLTTYELSVALGRAPAWWAAAGANSASRETDSTDGEGASELGRNPAETQACSTGSRESCSKEPSCSEGACGRRECLGSQEDKSSKGGEARSVEDEFGVYPMDYYTMEGGPWNSIHKVVPKPRQGS